MKLDNLSVILSFKYGILTQMIVVKKPVNNPAIIPIRVVFYHQSVIKSAGPNAEPSPLQA